MVIILVHLRTPANHELPPPPTPPSRSPLLRQRPRHKRPCSFPVVASSRALSSLLFTMLPLGALLSALGTSQFAVHVSLASLLHFIRLAITLKPVILHRQKAWWDPDLTPAELPAYVLAFLACHVGIPEECARELWAALGASIWTWGTVLLNGEEDDCQLDPREIQCRPEV